MQLRLAFLKKFGCRQVAIDIEREVPWSRRQSMQIPSALRWSNRRSSMLESFVSTSRKMSRRDSSTSSKSDSSYPPVSVLCGYYVI